jgi:hypothetical protein
MHTKTINAPYPAIASMRWPGYTIAGAGPLAVVLHCSYRVVLVMSSFEARLLMADDCCAVCAHKTDPHGRHRCYALDQPRQERQHLSMKRLPGWDD